MSLPGLLLGIASGNWAAGGLLLDTAGVREREDIGHQLPRDIFFDLVSGRAELGGTLYFGLPPVGFFRKAMSDREVYVGSGLTPGKEYKRGF